MINQFCPACGQPTTEYWTERYDGMSGQKLISLHCENPACSSGRWNLQQARETACQRDGGHRISWLGWLLLWPCKRCGYQPLGML